MRNVRLFEVSAGDTIDMGVLLVLESCDSCQRLIAPIECFDCNLEAGVDWYVYMMCFPNASQRLMPLTPLPRGCHCAPPAL